MNLPSSIPIMRSQRSLFIAGALGLLVLSNSAQAVVTVTFAQSGSNVTATLSGSFLVPVITARSQDDITGVDALGGSTTSLFAFLAARPGTLFVAFYDQYGLGQAFASGLSKSPDSFVGSLGFGYDNGFLLVDGAQDPLHTYSPSGTWTWNNETLASIGLGSLTSTPETVYRSGGGRLISEDTIQFVAVPEPSAALLGVASVGLLLSRRRRRALCSE